MPAESTLASDAHWMAQALELAARGRGSVEPNPLVGCVLVKNGATLSEGWHQRFGGPHAEIEALRQAGPRPLTDATMYVTLEPCSHYGKTAPCVDEILSSGIQRVVVAMQDPFPQVQGKGIARLRAAGIQVDVGCLEIEARQLNSPYLHLLATGRPWVIAKWACPWMV